MNEKASIVKRPERAKISAEESLKRTKEFDKRKEKFITAIRKARLGTETMSITVTISPEAQSKLERRAAVFGQDLKTFIRNLLEREAAQSLSEVAKPIYRQTSENNLSEAELEDLIDETLAEVRCEKPLSKR